jgi:hypothetical protein
MKKNIIDLFFLELAKQTTRPTEVIITGAVAGALHGHSRPSLDIDFEIRSKKEKDDAYMEYLDGVVREITNRMKIRTNYGEDIGHWSMIDLLEYRKKSLPYKMIGCLDIRIMAPEYWTIGKMGRFLEIDIQDMVAVIRKKKIKPDEMVELWARALKASPMSLAKRDFLVHVKIFLKTYGRKTWGKTFSPEVFIEKFERLVKIVR